MNAALRSPKDDAEWATYHHIRRQVLFELRGRGSSYDADHPDEHRTGHYPLVLWADGAAVGVLRVDITGTVAIFRRVAVHPELQRRGYGRELLRLAEEFARGHGCTRIESHVDPDAVAFYQRCGFMELTDSRRPETMPLMEKAIR
jgi:GNAT superfamily N-acetyltransferase